MHGTVSQSVSALASPVLADPPPPLTFEEAPEGAGRLILLALGVVALAALMVPFGLVLAHLASDPAARASLAAEPLRALQLGIAMVVLAGGLGWPLVHLLRTTRVRRTVTIEGGLVRVTTRSLLGRQAWAEPLLAFRGLAPRVTSSVSGVRHALVLVHPRRDRCVVLCSGSFIPADALAALSGLFPVAEISSREAASLASLHGSLPREREPQLAA
jgi:hypothetical protein